TRRRARAPWTDPRMPRARTGRAAQGPDARGRGPPRTPPAALPPRPAPACGSPWQRLALVGEAAAATIGRKQRRLHAAPGTFGNVQRAVGIQVGPDRPRIHGVDLDRGVAQLV